MYHFLSLPGLNFNQLLLHNIWLNFGYDILHDIPNVHKNRDKIWPPIITSNNFSIFFKLFKPLKCGACPCELNSPVQLGRGGFDSLALKHFPFSKYSQILANFKNLYKFDLKSEKFETNFIE
jgi:hypothetical protein